MVPISSSMREETEIQIESLDTVKVKVEWINLNLKGQRSQAPEVPR